MGNDWHSTQAVAISAAVAVAKISVIIIIIIRISNNNTNKRPLTPKSMPPAGDEHAKLKN